MGNSSKSLVNAARYIDAVYDIQIDENHPNLDQIIQKAMSALNSPEIEKYWYAYQLEIDPSLGEKIEESNVQNDATKDKKEARYYRGVLIEGSDDAIVSKKEKQNTELVEQRRAKILPFGG